MKNCPMCDTAYPSTHTTCDKDGALLIESQELEPGTVVRGKYRIVRLLGRGGMGKVYLAEHLLLGRPRALKFISSALSQDPWFLKRFRNEARATIELRHPNIVEVGDLDQAEDGSPYIAMEYVEGPELRRALAAGPFSVERALWIARGVAMGLGAAHAMGIVHRDVKPDNILLAVGRDGHEIPKLLDFGIAAIKENSTAISRTRGLMLTPEYAAPEQWRGTPADQLDGRTDLYALGGVLYEMLTGQTAFHAHNAEGWMFQHLHGEPQPPSILRPEVADWPGLDALVLSLLARDQEQRFPSAAALLDELAPGMAPPSTAPSSFAEASLPRPEPSAPHRSGPVSGPVPPRASDPAIRPVTGEVDCPVPATAPRTESTVDSLLAKLRTRTGTAVAAASLLVLAIVMVVAVIALRSRSPAAPPLLIPGGGTYTEAKSLQISDSTPGAIIHYTVDGNLPTEGSPVYTQPLVSLPSGTTVRAIATADGHKPSPAVSETYYWSSPSSTSVSLPGASTYNLGKDAYDLKQYAQARALFDQACTAGEQRACNYLGLLYAQGQGGTQDRQRAGELFQSACDHGYMDSCASLGILAQDAGKNEDARKYFQKACDGGSAESCKLLHQVE